MNNVCHNYIPEYYILLDLNAALLGNIQKLPLLFGSKYHESNFTGNNHG